MSDSDIFNPAPIPKSAYTDGTLWNYKLGVYKPAILVLYNGSWEILPQPAAGMNFVVSSLVTEGRNASGTFVGEQVGRDQIKFDGISYPFLYAHEWNKILNMLQIGRPTYFKYFDLSENKEIIRTLYPGDRTATIYAYAKEFIGNESTLRPEILSSCSVNLIDRGE